MPLPLDVKLLYQLSTAVIGGSDFNVVFKASDSPKTFKERRWFGKVWADLTSYAPFATMKQSHAGADLSPSVIFEHSIERALQIIFTRFATREFSEGIFVIRAEMGQDWFTPILQQPHCILRHMNYPLDLKSSQQSHRIMHGGNASALDLSNTAMDRDLSSSELGSPFLSQRKRRSTISTSHPTHFETCTVFYLGHNVKEFCSAFYSVGLIPGINSWYDLEACIDTLHRSAVMTVDPILDSEESSFELEDQTFAIPQGKLITLQDAKKTPHLGDLGNGSADPFGDTEQLLDLNTPDLGSLSMQYF